MTRLGMGLRILYACWTAAPAEVAVSRSTVWSIAIRLRTSPICDVLSSWRMASWKRSLNSSSFADFRRAFRSVSDRPRNSWSSFLLALVFIGASLRGGGGHGLLLGTGDELRVDGQLVRGEAHGFPGDLGGD